MTNSQINEELAKEKNNSLDNNNNLKVQENRMNQMDIEENKNVGNFVGGAEDIIMGGTLENNNNENQNQVNNIKEENINNKENENRIELLDYLFTFFPMKKKNGKN